MQDFRTTAHVTTIGPRTARPVAPMRNQMSLVANALYPHIRGTQPLALTADRNHPAPMLSRMPVQHGGLRYDRTSPLDRLADGTHIQVTATIASVRQTRDGVDIVLTDAIGDTAVIHLAADTAIAVASLLVPGRTVRARGRIVRHSPSDPATVARGGVQAVSV